MKKPTLTQKTITVKTDEKNPEPLEVLAQSIIDVANAFDKINNGRISQHAIIVLIKDSTGLSQRDIKAVLIACENLKKYIRK
jgi:uncharacterized protein (UPF0254 family)